MILIKWNLAFVDPEMYHITDAKVMITCPLGYERVYLPLCQVADTPFYINVDSGYFLWVFIVRRSQLRQRYSLLSENFKRNKNVNTTLNVFF